ncbi:uncharacterized protein [Canis lupus baileyi]|uniref:uncharacterized protein n=1 Tax=Canis lupus baileyi TaxID=143281 RepID=UPI003B9713FF
MSGVHVGARELLHARGWRPMPSARRRASDFPPFLAGEGRANEDAVTSSDLRVTACAAGRGGGVAFIRSGASSPAAQSSGAAGPARRTAVHPGAPLCAPTPSFGSAARARGGRAVCAGRCRVCSREGRHVGGARGGARAPARSSVAPHAVRAAQSQRLPASGFSGGRGPGRANGDAVTSSGLRVTACAAGRGGGVSLGYGAGPPRPLLRARVQPAQRAARRCTPALLSAPRRCFGSAARGPSLCSPRSDSLQPEVGLSAARGRSLCSPRSDSLQPEVGLSAARGRTLCSPSARPVSPQPEVGLCSPRSDFLQPEARLSAARARGRCLSVRSPMSLQPKPHVPAARRPSVRSPGSPQPEARGSAARRPSVRSPGSPQPEARGSAARRPSVRSPGSPQPEARGSAARRPSVPSRAAAGPQPEAPRRAPPRPRARLRGSRGGRAGRPRSCRSRSARAGLAFSVCQMERLLRAGRYAKRLGASAPIFLAAVIQFLTATVLGLAGDEARHRRTAYITPELVDRALHNHELLSGLFTMTTVSQVAPARY